MRTLALALAGSLALTSAHAQNPKAPTQVDPGLFDDVKSHLFENGEQTEMADGRPGDCLMSRTETKTGSSMLLGCQEVHRTFEKGGIVHPVIRYRFGGQVIVSETRRKAKGRADFVEAYVFIVDSEGMLKKALRIDAAGAKELDVKDAVTHGSWKCFAEQVLQLIPTIEA